MERVGNTWVQGLRVAPPTIRRNGCRSLVFSVVLVVGVLSPTFDSPVHAAPSGGLTANEIVKRVNDRDDGDSSSRTLMMKLTDRRGKQRVRRTRTFRKEGESEKRTVIFFESPKNVKGTAFLTYDYKENERDDDQWLYLPALRKVRRISAANRGDYFLGTDFSYDDIKNAGKISAEDYEFELLGEELLDGRLCYKVQATPVSPEVAKELRYGHVIQWVDPEIWMVRKSEVWDIRGNPLKDVLSSEIKQVDEIWTAHRIEVKNHKTGHQTEFVFEDVDYKSEISADLFTERSLRRGL